MGADGGGAPRPAADRDGWRLDALFETTAGPVRAGAAGDGPPLVRAHGWPWSSFRWHRVLPALARRLG